ncbi:DUF6230 family protein [Streptomyces sp. URMC 123]|uniref:DUF6230 family protein n=1 Tax=Streptomyces sp. URMC 123 TaxID=3423403 RepID=UPI003F1E3D79
MLLSGGRHRTGRGRRQPAGGRTNWRRFALVAPVALGLAGATVATTTAAAIPVSFAVAGSPFSVTAQHLRATGAVQFPGHRTDAMGTRHPVAVVGIREARMDGLCQSAVARTPLGTATLMIRSRHARPVHASDMVLDLARLEGDMTFRSVEMGRDAATLDGAGVTGPAGVYGQQARTLEVTDMRIKAWSLTAGLFRLNGAAMDVRAGDHPCR